MLIMEIYKRGTPHNLCTWKNPPFNSKVGYMIISKKENMSNPVLFLLVVCTIGIMGHPEEEGGAFEGDMILNPEQLNALEEQRSKKNAFASIRSGLWLTNGKADKIKYYIDPRVANAERVINLAIADYEKYTCLRFEKAQTKPSGSHIHFVHGTGCTSPVGKSYYGNRITLARGCWTKAIVMHEIGHSIGLFHEQSRPDRDSYVNIHYDKIQPRYKFAFDKYTTSRIDSRGTPYDLDSLMHYGQRYFSIDGSLTITTKNPKDQHRIGQRRGFSEIDIQQINKMYLCGTKPDGNCKDTHPDCKKYPKGCDQWGQGWKDWTKKYCRQTCKLC